MKLRKFIQQPAHSTLGQNPKANSQGDPFRRYTRSFSVTAVHTKTSLTFSVTYKRLTAAALRRGAKLKLGESYALLVLAVRAVFWHWRGRGFVEDAGSASIRYGEWQVMGMYFLNRRRVGFAKPVARMKRNPKILGQVRDVEGSLWDVRQIRDTKHSFDLLFGSPEPRLGSYRGGLPRLIATQPLIDFWEANRTKRDGVLFDLPAGRTTLKRVRRRFGFNNLDDIAEFWMERIEDLDELSARASDLTACYLTCRPDEQRSNEYGVVLVSTISMTLLSFGWSVSKTWMS